MIRPSKEAPGRAPSQQDTEASLVFAAASAAQGCSLARKDPKSRRVQKPNRHFQPVSRGSKLATSSRIASRHPDAHVQFARPVRGAGPLQAGMAAGDAGDQEVAAPAASTLPNRCTGVHAAEILLQSHPAVEMQTCVPDPSCTRPSKGCAQVFRALKTARGSVTALELLFKIGTSLIAPPNPTPWEKQRSVC